MTLDQAWLNVQQFHLTFGHPAPDKPTLLDVEQTLRRDLWIRDELNELFLARNMAEQADAFLDIIYFALGGLVEMGIRPAALFQAIQAANMRKQWPDGTVKRDERGKVIKPPGWEGPDNEIELEIERQCQESSK